MMTDADTRVDSADQSMPALRSMRAVALDIGNQDPFVATNRQLADALTRLDVPHTFEVYDGDHGNRVRERFEMHVLPFFSRQLTAPCSRQEAVG